MAKLLVFISLASCVVLPAAAMRVKESNDLLVDAAIPKQCKVDSITCLCELLVNDKMLLPSNRTIDFENPSKMTFYINGAALPNYRDADCIETPPDIDGTMPCRQCHDPTGRFLQQSNDGTWDLTVQNSSESNYELKSTFGNCLFRDLPSVCIDVDTDLLRCYKDHMKYAYIQRGTDLAKFTGEKGIWCEPWEVRGFSGLRQVDCKWETLWTPDRSSTLDRTCSLAVPNVDAAKALGSYDKATGKAMCSYKTKNEKCLLRLLPQYVHSGPVSFPVKAASQNRVELERCYDGDTKVAYIKKGTPTMGMKGKQLQCESWTAHNMRRRVMCEWEPTGVISVGEYMDFSNCRRAIPNWDRKNRWQMFRSPTNNKIYCGYETKLEKCFFRLRTAYIKGDPIASIIQ